MLLMARGSRAFELGLPCLVMGGHAVRFYGVDRTTIDYRWPPTGADKERALPGGGQAFAP